MHRKEENMEHGQRGNAGVGRMENEETWILRSKTVQTLIKKKKKNCQVGKKKQNIARILLEQSSHQHILHQ